MSYEIPPEPDVTVELVIRVRDGDNQHRLCFHAERSRVTDNPGDSPAPDTVLAFGSASRAVLAEATAFLARAYPEQPR